MKNLQQITLKQNRTLRVLGDPQRGFQDKDHHGTAGGHHYPTPGGADGKSGTLRELTALSLFSKRDKDFVLYIAISTQSTRVCTDTAPRASCQRNIFTRLARTMVLFFATVLTRVFSKRFHHAHHTVASARFATCTRSSTISRTSITSSTTPTNARRTNHYTTHLRNMLDCLAAWPSSVRSHNDKWLNKYHRGTVGGLHPTPGGQDGQIGTRRELKTFSQFVDCSRISQAARCDCHASDGGCRQTHTVGPLANARFSHVSLKPFFETGIVLS